VESGSCSTTQFRFNFSLKRLNHLHRYV